ncbi:hypothetical protein [Pseudomonas sp. DSV-1]|uniref:hypothetical protein n=1 Tax=Pseudomonas sp. DSV-1 TaxID=3112250 RepID=UPI002DB8C44C|nr:hypothetical protein [Pseudomonas sp. DSV-1]MEC4239129.1 hypothetical protein [Pseudomonas sp. DSV-1]
MTDKMREEFEESPRFRGMDFTRSTTHSEYYESPYANGAWDGWKASREVLVIELPEPEAPESYGVTRADDSEQYEVLESRMGAQYSAIHKCRRAIESAGVKVKP